MTSHRDVVVVGASAGGVEALTVFVAGLPPDLDAAVLVVLHVAPRGTSVLPQILDRKGPLAARHARDGDPLVPGTILVAPPDHHLTLRDGKVHLTHGPAENGHRPAVDPLFRSAARWHTRHVVGVVLSGVLDDGTAGQVAVHLAGGTTVVQDPRDALYPDMPQHVLEAVDVDHVVKVHDLGPLVARLVAEPLPDEGEDPKDARDRAIAYHDQYHDQDLMVEEAAVSDEAHRPQPPGTPAGLGCPSCGGSLFLIEEGGLARYRCRVGHAWSPESLLAEQSQALESALWLALRTLEDRVVVCERSMASARERHQPLLAQRYQQQRDEAVTAARLMRRALQDATFSQVRYDAPVGGRLGSAAITGSPAHPAGD